MTIYQSYTNKKQQSHISKPATPLDASWNTNGNEYELFKYVKQNSAKSIDSPWGVVSWKFEGKCQVALEDFLEASIPHFENGYDCFFINPMIGNEAIYLNVWEQGKDCGHTGLDTIENFLKSHFDHNITSIMDQNTFAFCNYFIATNRFWEEYFNYIDKSIKLLDAEVAIKSQIGLAYNSSAGYARNLNQTLRPFVIERLFSPFLLSTKMRFTNYKHSIEHYQRKFGIMLGKHLFNLSDLKKQAITQKNKEKIQHYLSERSRILNIDYKKTIWHLDDPNNTLY